MIRKTGGTPTTMNQQGFNGITAWKPFDGAQVAGQWDQKQDIFVDVLEHDAKNGTGVWMTSRSNVI